LLTVLGGGGVLEPSRSLSLAPSVRSAIARCAQFQVSQFIHDTVNLNSVASHATAEFSELITFFRESCKPRGTTVLQYQGKAGVLKWKKVSASELPTDHTIAQYTRKKKMKDTRQSFSLSLCTLAMYVSNVSVYRLPEQKL